MNEHEENATPCEDIQEEEGTNQSKREFMTKLMTAAGVIAISGLTAEASAAVPQNTQMLKLSKAGTTQYKFYKERNAFRVTLSGRDLGMALQSSGLIAEDANLDNAKITIEFSS